MALNRKFPLNYDAAEAIALQGLTFLASDSTRLARFLGLTGIVPADLRAWAEKPRLQAAVVEHLLADESLLLVFTSETGTDPGTLGPAFALLQGAADAGGD